MIEFAMKVDIYHHNIPKKFEFIHRIVTQARFDWNVGRPEPKERRKPIMLELSCTNEEKIKIRVNPVTTTGTAVALDGPIQVSVQSGEGMVEPIDEKSFYVVSGQNPGDTGFLVSGDADLGDGVESISDVILLHVAGAKASSLGLVAETPEPK